MATFTTRWLESIKVSKQTDFIDRSEAGLMFRVAPSGIKSWSLMYRRQSDESAAASSSADFPRSASRPRAPRRPGSRRLLPRVPILPPRQ